MGSLREWLMVTFYCVFWGRWMLAWETRKSKRRAANANPAFLPANVFIWILSGLTFGLLTTFKWQALPSPLLFITVGSLCGLAITRLRRHERSKAFKQPATWMEDCVLFRFDEWSRIASCAPSHPPHDWRPLPCCSRSTFGTGLLPVQATRIATNHQVKFVW